MISISVGLSRLCTIHCTVSFEWDDGKQWITVSILCVCVCTELNVERVNNKLPERVLGCRGGLGFQSRPYLTWTA